MRSRSPQLVAAMFLLVATQKATAAEPSEGKEYQYRDEGDIRRALDETLSHPDFARLRTEPKEKKEPQQSKSPDWLERFLRWLSGLGGEKERENDGSTTGLSFSFAGMRLLLFGMAVTILLAAVIFIIKSVLATRRDRRIATAEDDEARVFQPGSAPGELPPDEYWHRALAHGQGGRYREGIRELLLGAMSATERRGLIRFRKGLTNRDYLYSVRGPARDSFGRIASSFEHVYFGRRDATSEAFQKCCQEYSKSFQESAT
jgi:Domain of unknown function (DUF4129)